MARESKVTLNRVTELDRGGTRLAVHGEVVAVADHGEVTLWRNQDREFHAVAPGPIDRLRFRDDAELFAAPYVLALPAKIWASLGELEPALISGMSGPPAGDLRVRHADWSADGRELLAYVEYRPPRRVVRDSGVEPPARLLWLDRAREVLAVPWEGRDFELTSVLLGTRWAVAAGQGISVWDRHTRAPIATLSAHALVVRDLALSADEQLLASVSNDHKVVLTDTATWKPRASWEAHDGEAIGVAFHPELPLLATTGEDGQVRVWTLAGKRVAAAATRGPGNAVAFSPDGSRLIVTTDQKTEIFSVELE